MKDTHGTVYGFLSDGDALDSVVDWLSEMREHTVELAERAARTQGTPCGVTVEFDAQLLDVLIVRLDAARQHRGIARTRLATAQREASTLRWIAIIATALAGVAAAALATL